MVLSDVQIKNVLVQLGIPEEQITKELIEEIQLNCKSTIDIISFVDSKGIISGSSSTSQQNTMEGILIAASNEPRFDVFFDNETKKPIPYSDFGKVRYLPDEDCYILTESEDNVKILNPVEYYIGYMLVHNNVILLKSNMPLPTTPQYIKVSGRQYRNVFVVNNVIEIRELSESEWEILNDYIDSQIPTTQTTMFKECNSEPVVFIGRVRWSSIENQGTRGILDQRTVFRIGHGNSAINISASGIMLPRNDAGIYIGLLTVKKRVKEDGTVTWRRTILHPVKIQK